MKHYFAKSMLACVASAMLLSQAVYACDAKCEKKVAKSAASYEKAIKKAETKSCKAKPKQKLSKVVKRCAKDIKKLDKRHGKFKDEIKSHADIKVLKKRHDKLNASLAIIEEKVALQKTINKFNNNIYKMRNYCIEADGERQCKGQADSAQKEYDSFSSSVKSKDAVKALKKEFDDLLAQNAKEVKNRNTNRANSKAAGNAYEDFVAKRRKLGKEFSALQLGKQNKGRDGLSLLDKLKTSQAALQMFKKDCEGQYATVKEGSRGKEVVEYCDLAKNQDKYIKQFKDASSKAYVDELVNTYTNSIKELKEKGYMYNNYFNIFLHDFDDYIEKVEDETSNVSLKPLKKLHDDFEDALEIAFDKNSWDLVKEDMADGFEADLKEVAKRDDLKFIKGGYKGGDWKINKNSLGVPLSKYRGGYAMMKHPKDSKERMYFVTFYRDYAGAGDYQKASRVKMERYAMPVDD